MKQLFWLVVLVALLLAGCGSGNEITIRTDGMRFVQDEVHVKAGEAVTLHVVNTDGYAHAFDLDEFDIHTSLLANATFDAEFTPTEPGRYRFYCGSPGHVAAGMEGVLVVEP
jgi:uncharacterized cupredoxin-like copper-binding protein